MIFDLSTLDLKTLRALHDGEARELERKLLGGATWQEVRNQQKKLTELSAALHKKLAESGILNPDLESNDLKTENSD